MRKQFWAKKHVSGEDQDLLGNEHGNFGDGTRSATEKGNVVNGLSQYSDAEQDCRFSFRLSGAFVSAGVCRYEK